MKISNLVFYLAVIFGSIYCISCRTYNKKDVNLIEEAADGNYDMSYFNVSLERSLSRHKRANFIIGLLTGQEGLCPNTEKLSIDLIGKMILHPIQITKTILCHIVNIIGKENRAITHRLFNTFSDFLRTIFLSGLHTTLNQIANTGILPSSLRTLVEMFNVFYNALRLVGYIK
ncbi:unnamed protein product [Lasius platythorax]|uniref:Uncharacterized protein n=1 Tax=Lasius platythorax TaxID=488582 RepID=A0AAV2N2E1_9HYME